MSTINVRPLNDRILVKRVEEDQTTKGGIIIPDSAKQKPQRGQVVAAGEGRMIEGGKKIPLDVKVGDVILFGRYSGTEIELNGEDYLMMKEEDILGIIN